MISNINIVPTTKDQLEKNSIWCISFQLVWNDFQNKLLNNNFSYNKDSLIINNLMSDTDKDSSLISEENYFKIVAHNNPNLKNEINDALYKKFKEHCLLTIDSANSNSIILYSFLKKIFSFKTHFKNLYKGSFGNSNNKIQYFGIPKYCLFKKKLSSQAYALFYNSENDYAVSIKSKESDRIILYRTDDNKNFSDTFKDIEEKMTDNLIMGFNKKDTLKIPVLNFKKQQSFDKLIKEEFIPLDKDDSSFVIENALQDIEFTLDRKGGKVKSEAMLKLGESSFFVKQNPITRNYNFDNTFYLFILESNKPYFAARIEDID